MNSAYRSAYDHLIGERLAAIAEREEHAEPLIGRLQAIGHARAARIASGGVGILGATLMVMQAIYEDDSAATYALLGAGGAAILTYVILRVAFALGARPLRFVTPALSGDLKQDLETLSREHRLAKLLKSLDDLEALAVDLPLVATSLLAPLTIHFLVALALWQTSARDFATWIRFSLVMTGHAHVALAYVTTRFGKRLRARVVTSVQSEWAKALGVAVLVVSIPGILLLGVPPIIAVATGLAFIPFMYVATKWRSDAERAVIGMAAPDRVTPAPEAEAPRATP